MSKSKTYYSAKDESGMLFEIFWVKNQYIKKSYQELTVRLNGLYHRFDIDDIKRCSISTIASAYMKNITFGNKWINDDKFMNNFIQLLEPIIEEFQKDVEYHYSFDGWIGRIFIEPIERFFEWLKK